MQPLTADVDSPGWTGRCTQGGAITGGAMTGSARTGTNSPALAQALVPDSQNCSKTGLKTGLRTGLKIGPGFWILDSGFWNLIIND